MSWRNITFGNIRPEWTSGRYIKEELSMPVEQVSGEGLNGLYQRDRREDDVCCQTQREMFLTDK
jgi:hypothetical protein